MSIMVQLFDRMKKERKKLIISLANKFINETLSDEKNKFHQNFVQFVIGPFIGEKSGLKNG